MIHCNLRDTVTLTDLNSCNVTFGHCSLFFTVDNWNSLTYKLARTCCTHPSYIIHFVCIDLVLFIWLQHLSLSHHLLPCCHHHSSSFMLTLWLCSIFVCWLVGSKVENKQLLVDKFIPKVTSAVMTAAPASNQVTDNDTVKAPLV